MGIEMVNSILIFVNNCLSNSLNMDNVEKYDMVFIESFSIEEKALKDLEYNTIEQWDSIGHMSLIADLEDKLSRAQVISPETQQASVVRFGAWVTLSDEDTGEEKKYRIGSFTRCMLRS